MKGKKPIYVSAEMNTTMEKLWEYTQEPHIHTEWDARFTEISYVEKQEGEPQKFLYKTKIGFGLEIAGEGESIGEIRKETGECISSLKFWTDNTLSLIQIGRGYWKYTPRKEHIHFETQYDYDTRYGRIGNVIDFYMFRPLLGWATAWSFDALKLWLEKGLHPRLLIRRTMTYWLVCFLFAFVWLYQGIVPKLIFTHPEEVKMLSVIIGLLEVIFGVIWLLPFPKRNVFILHIFVLIALTIAAGFTNIVSFTEPFNPITLNVLLMGVSIVGYINSFDLPSAKNCKRKRKG
ncbi:DoxX-like family protein [Bacillus thuringiensis]|uniref:DoxX-like family protein n=1 Tax=Bacillus thuringiensis TaxID=1428 RepID=UPI002FBE8D00